MLADVKGHRRCGQTNAESIHYMGKVLLVFWIPPDWRTVVLRYVPLSKIAPSARWWRCGVGLAECSPQ
ncbi:hypothetical protein Bwad001_00660 [Bilophila wadsworthia]|jgi:hypothetical protein